MSGNTDNAKDQLWSGILREHLALVTTTAVFVLVVARVLLVTRLNVASALAIIAASGAVDVALGVIVSSYWAVIVLSYLVTDAWRRIATRRGGHAEAAYPVQLFLGVAMIAFVPILVAALYIAMPIIWGYWDRRLEERRGVQPEPWTSSGTIAYTVVFAVFIVGQAVWLPAEVIATDNSPDPFVAYVLATDDGWTTVLMDEDRSVVRLKSEAVTDRVVCTPSDQQNGSTLAGFFLDPSHVVPCDDALQDVAGGNG